jgi:hypothetical protein
MYKKRTTDEDTRQHHPLTALWDLSGQTTMRLSALALLIALPAAAYAAACTKQLSIDSEVKCAERGEWCSSQIACCGRLECQWNGFSTVCLGVHGLARY